MSIKVLNLWLKIRMKSCIEISSLVLLGELYVGRCRCSSYNIAGQFETVGLISSPLKIDSFARGNLQVTVKSVLLVLCVMSL